MSRPGFALLKVVLAQSFDFRKKDKIKNASLLIPILFIFIFGCLLSSIYSISFSIILISGERKESLNLVLYALAGTSSMLALVTSITKVKGILFGGNDYEMLASLPIPRRNIIFVKLFSLYLVQLFYTAIFVLPATLIVCVLGKYPLWLIDGILLLVFSPVIPLLLAGVLGLLIGFISDRFRFGNILTILIYILFLGAIMYSSFLLNSKGGEEELDVTIILQMLNILSWINPTTKLLTLTLGGINQLLYIAGNGIILLGMIFIFAKCYDYFHFLMTAKRASHTYVWKAVKQKGQFKALFLMDIKRYFSSKMYLMNTITGGIMCILLTVIMIISFKNVKDPEAMNVLSHISPYFILINTWCIGMAVPSAVAINMEGRAMWQMKVLPINYKTYSHSKILLSYLVLAPFILISSSIWIVFMEITVTNILLTFILPQIYLLSMSMIAFLVNTYFYKLKWTNEVEAVKNSAGMVISMLIDLGYTAILCALFVVPGVFGYFVIGTILALLFVSLMAGTAYILINKLCFKNIESIEC